MQAFTEDQSSLHKDTQLFARLMAGIIEESEAISIYEQRISAESNTDAVSIWAEAQQEEMKHFAMQLAAVLRLDSEFEAICKGILFQTGDIVQLAKAAEKKVG